MREDQSIKCDSELPILEDVPHAEVALNGFSHLLLWKFLWDNYFTAAFPSIHKSHWFKIVLISDLYRLIDDVHQVANFVLLHYSSSILNWELIFGNLIQLSELERWEQKSEKVEWESDQIPWSGDLKTCIPQETQLDWFVLLKGWERSK